MDNLYFPTYKKLASYDHLVAKVPGENLFYGDGGVKLTVQLVKDVVKKYHKEVDGLAQHLKGNSYLQSAYNCWHFVKYNIRYQLDTEGEEEVRSPGRTWKDRKGDCEDMTIFISSLLECMGYGTEPGPQDDIDAEVVGFKQDGTFGHIFPVFGGYILDAVPTMEFNKRAPGITNTMRVSFLHGIEGIGCACSKTAIHGLGAIAEPDTVTTKLMDYQTSLMNGTAGLSAKTTASELRKVRYLILMNGTEERELLLELMPFVQDIDDEGYLTFYDDVDQELLDEYMTALEAGEFDLTDDDLRGIEEEIAGIGDLGKKSAAKKAKQEKKKAEKKVKKAKKKEKIKKVFKKVGGAVKKAGKAALKVGKGLIKFNPVTVTVRNTFLAILRLNKPRISSKLKDAYLTDEQARQKGLEPGEFAKLKKTVNDIKKIFVAIGGNESSMKNAIIKGGGGLSGIVDYADLEDLQSYEELEGLGLVPVAAGGAVSAPFIAKVMDLLKKINFKKLYAGAKKGTVDPQDTEEIQEQETPELTPQNKGFNSESEQKSFAKMTRLPEPQESTQETESDNSTESTESTTEESGSTSEGVTNTNAAPTSTNAKESSTTQESNEEKKTSGGIVPLLLTGGAAFVLKKIFF